MKLIKLAKSDENKYRALHAVSTYGILWLGKAEVFAVLLVFCEFYFCCFLSFEIEIFFTNSKINIKPM